MKNTLFLLSLIFFSASQNIEAQTDTVRLTLSEVIALAQSDAPDALLAETRMKSNYWRYRSAMADFKPGISLDGNLPNLTRSIDAIPQPDGTDKFLRRSQMNNGVSLRLNQEIAATGGRIFTRSGLQRIDVFREDAPNLVQYLSTPIAIGIEQPLFGLNELKWTRRIAPLEYQEATRSFAEQMEDVAFEAAQNFFSVLIAQLDLEAARRDKANADTLFNISKGRFEVGRIAETELLQIELSAMNANAAVQRALLDLQAGTERLRNFLGIQQATFFTLEAPTEIPEFLVETETALQYAKVNRSEVVGFERRLAEADFGVAAAKANSGLQANVYAEFGLSQTAEDLGGAFSDPLDNEVVGLGFQIPIADWGKARARLETAQALQELEQVSVAQDRVNFEQDIILKVNRFGLQREQVALALRAYEVSLKRLEMTRNRYYIGKIGITDLNIAINEKEGARTNYMAALQELWLAHYDLRRSTLFDFERGVSLVRSVEDY